MVTPKDIASLRSVIALACALGVCGSSTTAAAHHGAYGSLVAQVKGSGEVDVLLDLDGVTLGDALRLDRDGNNVVDEAELRGGREAIESYIERHFAIANEGSRCPVSRVERFAAGGAQKRVQLLQVYECESSPGVVRFEHKVLMEEAGGHRHMAQIQVGSNVFSHVFARERTIFEVDASALSPTKSAAAPPGAPEAGWKGWLGALVGLGLLLGVAVWLWRRRRGGDQHLVAVCAGILVGSLAAPWPCEAQTLTKEDLALIEALKGEHPEAIPLIKEAVAAKQRRDLDRASEIYAALRVSIPDNVTLTRRHCLIESSRFRRQEAIALCEKAVKDGGTATDHSALAVVTMTAAREMTAPPRGALRQAMVHALKAVEIDPDNPAAHSVVCSIALSLGDIGTMTVCVRELERTGPERVNTHTNKMQLGFLIGDLDLAEEGLEQARVLGLHNDIYRSFKSRISAGRPFWHWWYRQATLGISAWLGLMLLLTLLGLAMSRATLRVVEAASQDRGGAAIAASARRRRLYTRVLWACCFWFYVSTALSMLAIFAGLFAFSYGMVTLGVMAPDRMATLCAALMLLGAALTRHMFLRPRRRSPGTPLSLEDHPRLKAALDQAALHMKTRPVDAVYLTSTPTLSIVERGSMMEQLEGQRERRLILGLPTLDGLTLGAFEALLAQQYGHFSSRDPAKGGFARAIRLAIAETRASLRDRGADRWTNPTWIAISAYHRVFEKISEGSADLQRLMSDRWSAQRHGAEALATGLRHLHQGEGAPLGDRIALFEGIEAPEAPSERAKAPSWSLFEDKEALEASVGG